MRTILFLLGVLILASSCNNPKTKKGFLSTEEVLAVKEKLDSNLVRGVLNLVQTEEHLKYPEIKLNESFIVMGFLVTSEHLRLDSIILISYCHSAFRNDNNENNYKGMLNIEGYNVAIFDKDNFRDKYYNIDSLKQISIEDLKSYPMKTLFTEQYYVIEGKLKYIGSIISPDPDLYKKSQNSTISVIINN